MQPAIEMGKLRQESHQSGFTLVELSIVLVIIGLIIGGVLVGQDLIRAAEIRAQITQIEQYNAAVNTFRNRFNGMPGDIRNATEFFPTAQWASMRNGNGNRQLEYVTNAASGLAPTTAATYSSVDVTAPLHVGEVLQFWHHLSAAELINGSFNGTGGSGANTDNFGTLAFSFPTTRLDRNGVGVFASEGRNYYQLGVISGSNYNVEASLTPEEAFNIDSKVDDGRPTTGSVMVRSSIAASATAPALINADLIAADTNFAGGGANAASACIQEAITLTNPTSVRSATYAIGNSAVACTIRLRMN